VVCFGMCHAAGQTWQERLGQEASGLGCEQVSGRRSPPGPGHRAAADTQRSRGAGVGNEGARAVIETRLQGDSVPLALEPCTAGVGHQGALLGC
jgi:hypothetical protein